MSRNAKKKARTMVKGLVRIKKSLAKVKDTVRQNLGEIFLSSMMEDYVEDKYYKYCILHLEKTLLNQLNTAEEINLSVIEDTIQDLHGASEPGELSSKLITLNPYFQLIKDVLDGKTNDQERKERFNRLKCYKLLPLLAAKGDQFVDQNEEGSLSLEATSFVTYLQKYLTDFKTQFVSNLHEDLILNENIGNNEVLGSEWNTFARIYSKNSREASQIHWNILKQLEDEKRQFVRGKKFPEKEVEKMLELMNAPVKFTVDKSFDRLILVVSHPVIVLSQVKNEIGQYFEEQREIDEVQIQASEIFYIDTYLEKEIWHGKNICIMSPVISCVVDDVCWDVSGPNGDTGGHIKVKQNTTRGSNTELNGRNGEDGGDGESGGNVTLLCKEYLNIDRLQIHSNGGDGGCGGIGENGDKGEDGLCGHSMTLEEIKELFNTPVRHEKGSCEKIVKNIRDRSKDVQRDEFKGFDDNGKKISSGIFSSRSIFLQGYFEKDMKYEFSFSQHTSGSSAYLLVSGQRGTLGKPGGLGGLGGYGGLAGHPGNINLLNIFGEPFEVGGNSAYLGPYIVTNGGKAGDDGDDGEDGPPGQDGTDGLDVGYMDTTSWIIGGAEYFHNGKFIVKERRGSWGRPNDKRVWCEFSKSYKSIIEYTPEPHLRRVIERRSYYQRRTTKNRTAQKKTAIDLERAIQISANLQREAITVQQFRDKTTAVTNWAALSKSAIQARKNRETRTNINNKYKTEIIRPAPEVEDEKVKLKERKHSKAASQDNLSLKCALTLDYYLESQQDVINLADAYLHDKESTILEHMQSPPLLEAFVKQPVPIGADSALHAIFGEVHSVTEEVSLNNASEFRGRISKELVTWLGNTPTLDNETKKAFKSSLKTLMEGSQRSEINSDQVIGQNLEKFLQMYALVHLHGKEFHWNQLDNYRPALKEYLILLENPSIPFLKSDLVLISKACRLSLHYFQEVKKGSGEYSPVAENPLPQESPSTNRAHLTAAISEKLSLSTREESREILLTLDEESGNYSRICRKVKADTSLPQQLVSDLLDIFEASSMSKKATTEIRDIFKKIILKLFCSPSSSEDVFQDYSAIAAFWPVPLLQLFFYFGLIKGKAEAKDTKTLKIMFVQITQEMMTSDNLAKVIPFFFVVLAYPVKDWGKQLCLVLIQKLYGISKVNHYKEAMTDLPNDLLLQLVRLLQISQHAGEFHGEGGNARFGKFVEKLDEYRPFDQNWDYSCLDGLPSSEQWYHQLGKLKAKSQLEKVSQELWNDSSNKFSQAFYYYYHLFDTKPKEATKILELYSGNGNDDRNQLSSILSKFYSGCWPLNEDILNILENCESLREWNSKLDMLHDQDQEGERTRNIAKMVKADPKNTLSPEMVHCLLEMMKELEIKRKPKTEVATVSEEKFKQVMDRWLVKFRLQRLNPLKKKSTFYVKLDRSGQTDQKFLYLVLKALRMIDNVIYRFLNSRLRETQKLVILASFLSCPKTEEANLLAQMKTGEGKSWVVLTVAIIRGLFDQKTDVVTSSSVLAQRDATGAGYRKIYEAFDLSVGHVTMDNQQQRAREYQKTVVYGEVTHFQRDYLIDHFYNQNVRGSRKFQNIIIDEVDSMFLDKGNSVLYLSHTPPGLNTLEHIFLFIWNSVVQGVNNGQFDPKKIHAQVMDSIYLTLEKNDLQGISDTDLQHFRDLGVLDEKNRIVNEDPRLLEQVDSRVTSDCGILKCLTNLKLKNKLELYCPNHLKRFVKLHLATWIKSAYQATKFQQDVQYVLHTDRLNSNADKNSKITIIDLDTGVDLKDSQWSDGLHQFLQIKHGCKLTSLSLKSVFISNITFFNMYKNIFGLTGTLGTDADRGFLQQTYKVDLLLVPTALPRRFTEDEPLLSSNITNWHESIFSDASDKIKRRRSVLILCETVHSAEGVYGYLRNKLSHMVETENFYLYRRDFEPFSITANGRTLEPGRIIVATNLAGRGTDIKLSDALITAGGLHVIFSYVPHNARVWWQGLGRAGRCGDPGSGRLIFLGGGSREGAAQSAIDILIERDHQEMSRVSEIRTHYDNVVKQEELKFEAFRKHFDQFSHYVDQAYKSFLDNFRSLQKSQDKLLSGNADEIKEIAKFSMLDDWAFWLDEYSKHLQMKVNASPLNKQCQDKLRRKEDRLMKRLGEMTDCYRTVISKYAMTTEGKILAFQLGLAKGPEIEKSATEVVHEPALLVKIAQVYIARNDFKTALTFLEKVLENEEKNAIPSIIAQYYEIFCQIKLDNLEADNIAKRCLALMSKLELAAALQLEIVAATRRNQFINNQKIFMTEGLRRQKEASARILFDFQKSLEDIVGRRGIDEDNFSDILDGCRFSAQWHIQDLLENGSIALPKVTPNAYDDIEFRKLAMNYALQSEVVKMVFKSQRDKELTSKCLKKIKTDLNLPSTKGFWQEIQSALEDPIDVSIILDLPLTTSQKNENEDSDSGSEEDETNPPDCPPNYFHLWGLKKSSKHSGHQFFITKKNTVLTPSFHGKIVQGSKAEFNKNPEFLYFQKRGLAWLDTVAWVNSEKLRNVELQSYFSMTPKDFQILPELDEQLAEDVFQECVKGGIFDASGVPRNFQSDLTFTSLNSSSLLPATKKILKKLEHEISALIRVKCCYQLERLRLLQEIDKLSCASIPEPNSPASRNSSIENYWKQLEICNLAERPFHKFIFDAIHLGIIENTKVAHLKDTRIQTGAPTLKRQHLQKIYPKVDIPFIETLYAQLHHSRWINNSNGNILLELDHHGTPSSTPRPQSQTDIEKYCYPDIFPVIRLLLKQANRNVDKQFKARLRQLHGNLDKKIHLHNLQAVPYPDRSEKVDWEQEIETFKVNAFDQIISREADGNIPLSRDDNALAILVIAASQALGGTQLSGNHDKVYSLLALRLASFNWSQSQWSKYKVINLALTSSAVGDFFQRSVHNKNLAFVGKSLVHPSSASVSGMEHNILLQFTQQQEFCHQFGSHLERFVNILTLKLTELFSAHTEKLLAKNLSLNNALLHLFAIGDLKRESQLFSECKQKAAKKTTEDHPTEEYMGQLVDCLVQNVLNPALCRMKRFQKKAFYDEEFSKLAKENVEKLDTSRDTLVYTAGISRLILSFIANFEMELQLSHLRQNVEEEAVKQRLSEFKREIGQELIPIISQAITVGVTKPLLSHGIQKLFKFAKQQQKARFSPSEA